MLRINVLLTRAAARAGVPVTLHAGECPDWKFGTIENVRYAVDELGAARIGHGLALGKHLDLARRYSHLGKVAVEVGPLVFSEYTESCMIVQKEWQYFYFFNITEIYFHRTKFS